MSRRDCGVFIDLIKAFDTVNHNVLLTNLEHYGIRGNALGRFQSSVLGVLQGSVLGPLLFFYL